jgi:OPA family glycerol-3-phosphate transporter-like MFS transporter
MQAGVFGSMFALGYGVGKLFSGFLADMYQAKVLFACGLFVCALELIAFALMSDYIMMVFVWTFYGLAQGFGYPPVRCTARCTLQREFY